MPTNATFDPNYIQNILNNDIQKVDLWTEIGGSHALEFTLKHTSVGYTYGINQFDSSKSNGKSVLIDAGISSAE